MRTDRWKSMGKISRFGGFAVASSKENQQQQQHQPTITCTTFNILAPIYKRINHEVLLFLTFSMMATILINHRFKRVMSIFNFFFLPWKQDPSCRESDYRAYWLARNHRILDWLLNEMSSIICLQVCVVKN